MSCQILHAASPNPVPSANEIRNPSSDTTSSTEIQQLTFLSSSRRNQCIEIVQPMSNIKLQRSVLGGWYILNRAKLHSKCEQSNLWKRISRNRRPQGSHRQLNRTLKTLQLSKIYAAEDEMHCAIPSVCPLYVSNGSKFVKPHFIIVASNEPE